MIEIEIPKTKEFDTSNASALAASIVSINSFGAVADWDQKAAEEVESIRSVIKAIEIKRQNLVHTLALEQQEHDAKSLVAKIFSWRGEHRRLSAEQVRLTSEKTQIEDLINQFETAIDFTPDSPDDLKELIKELKQTKKELQMEKKEINAEMASIRVEARQQTSNAASGKYGKWDRRYIRLNKESSLQPHETEKAMIDRKIIKIDRVILWLEKIK